VSEKSAEQIKNVYTKEKNNGRFLNCDAKTFILYARFMVEISMQHEIVFWADQMEWIPIL